MKGTIKDTWEAIYSAFTAFGKLFNFYFNPNDNLMSDEAKKIFSNYTDRKKYIDAVEYLKKHPSETIEIELTTKEKIKLIS